MVPDHVSQIIMFHVYSRFYSKNNMRVPLDSNFPVTEQLRSYGKSVLSITLFSGIVLTSVFFKDKLFMHVSILNLLLKFPSLYGWHSFI